MRVVSREGSVYQRKGDGRWVAQVRDPATGKQRYAYYATEAAARRALRRMATRAEEGQVLLDSGATLEAYIEAWLPLRAGRRRRPSTVREYGRRLKKYVIPLIGGIRLRELTVIDVEDALDDLAGRGLGRSTIAGTRNALAAVLQDAVRARHLSANLARLALLPEDTAPPSETSIPTSTQVVELLDAAMGTRLEYLLVVLATTGTRIGEALGAQWVDLDLEVGTWTVARTTTLDASGKITLGRQPKANGSRVIVLPPEAIAALRNQRKQTRAERLACLVWEDHDLVFPSEVGTPWDPRNARKVLRPIATRAKFPGSFHALRHHFASVAVSSVPLPVAAKILGHKRAATTSDVYGHLLESDAGKVALSVSSSVKAARTKRDEASNPLGHN